jgi:hypothetical protein
MLFSWDEVEEGAWEDPDFLKAFEGKGEKVTVQEGDAKSVNLTPIKTSNAEEQKALALGLRPITDCLG